MGRELGCDAASPCGVQDPKYPVENLLLEDGHRPWLSCPRDRSRQLRVELQLERASAIGYVDVGPSPPPARCPPNGGGGGGAEPHVPPRFNAGNCGCAFLQVEVGRSSWPLDRPFLTLVPSVALMTPADSKLGQNRCGVRMFKEGKDRLIRGEGDPESPQRDGGAGGGMGLALGWVEGGREIKDQGCAASGGSYQLCSTALPSPMPVFPPLSPSPGPGGGTVAQGDKQRWERHWDGSLLCPPQLLPLPSCSGFPGAGGGAEVGPPAADLQPALQQAGPVRALLHPPAHTAGRRAPRAPAPLPARPGRSLSPAPHPGNPPGGCGDGVFPPFVPTTSA